ncbi:MAG: 7-carboxy-7-deazaguanine synthase QueE [Bacteroidetes bacterium]|nr:7-carboxy-7-deazaguanine synthase QueE [Bacteroidota bacterium]
MEHFYTLQGEGMHQGKAAYFIRLAGCDVGCVWCDVKESWDRSKHPDLSIDELLAAIQQTPTEIVVITGGEPLMHNLSTLTTRLKHAGYKTHLETSGAHPLSGTWDWICLSPKKFRAPQQEIFTMTNELKVVIFHPSDFAWAEQYALQMRTDTVLYLQPEWDRSAEMIPLIVDYVKAHPRWRATLQVHKYLNVP